MLKGIRWQQQLLVATAFCGVYLLVRGVSLVYFAHWMPQAGIWLGGVLLLPRRFWLALLGANVVALIPGAYACFDQYGWSGSLLHLVPISAFAIWVTWPLRAHLPGTVSGKWVLESITAKHMVALLACIFAFALLTAADGTWQYSLTFLPGQNAAALIRLWAPRYVLGNYLGCLSVVPLALAIHQAICRSESWSDLARQMGRSRLLLEGVVLGLTAVGLLTAMGAGIAGDIWRPAARMALFLPVAWMAVRYGWQGAAVGGAAASIGILLSMPAQYDAGVINAQNFMAMLITVLLPLGAKINRLNEQERRFTSNHRQVLRAARREIYQGEMRLHREAKLLNELHEEVVEGYSRLLNRLETALTDSETQSFRVHLVLVKRLMLALHDSIHPTQWQRRGLRAALSNGPITQTLKECGVSFDDHVSEKVVKLTIDAQWTLYRLACEAVAYTLLDSPTTTGIRLSVRVMMVGPQRNIPWAVVVVTGEPRASSERSVLPPFAYHRHVSHVLQSRLGAIGLDLDDMSDRVGLYEGRVRTDERLKRITLSMLDVVQSR